MSDTIPTTAHEVADAEIDTYGEGVVNLRWSDLTQSVHTVATKAYALGRQMAEDAARADISEWLAFRADLRDILAHVDGATDPRTLALRILARLEGNPAWESVEYEDEGWERIDPEMIPTEIDGTVDGQ